MQKYCTLSFQIFFLKVVIMKALKKIRGCNDLRKKSAQDQAKHFWDTLEIHLKSPDLAILSFFKHFLGSL